MEGEAGSTCSSLDAPVEDDSQELQSFSGDPKERSCWLNSLTARSRNSTRITASGNKLSSTGTTIKDQTHLT